MIRIFAALLALSFCLYTYLNEQNRCTEVKMKLPKLTKEIAAIRDVNANLAYQIECFENPQHLLALASTPAYSHLKFPYAPQIMTVREGLAVQVQTGETHLAKNGSQLAMFVGAKN
jgi:hypothetical protein